jgi:sec-independent protein translocase protein TatA
VTGAAVIAASGVGWYSCAKVMRPGLLEIAIILGIALLLFGAGRLADVGKGLGEGIRNFKRGLKDKDDEDDDDEPEQLPEGKGKSKD